ncbi:hypothetical protein HYX03_04485 [Candidatus Woesearchaeota archaeon]|nr:hypothetical protein [Candidatus Woesearchaeota archaeon]
MADAEGAATVPAEGKKEEKKEKVPSGLENLVKDAGPAVNGLLALGATALGGLYTSMSAATLSQGIQHGLRGASVVASQPLATMLTNENPNVKELRNDAFFGLAQLPAIDYIVNTAVSYGSPLATIGVTMAAMPLLVGAMYPIRYFLLKGNLKGFGKDFKENFFKYTARTSLFFGVPLAIGTAFFAPYALYFAAAGNLLYRFWNGYKSQKPEEKISLIKYTYKSATNFVKNITTPIVGAVSYVGSTVRKVYTASREIGSAFYSTLSEWFKPSPAPAPAK